MRIRCSPRLRGMGILTSFGYSSSEGPTFTLSVRMG
jgi:hypothetical protein